MLYILERVNIKGAWALTQFVRDGGWIAGFNRGMLGRRCRVGLVHLIKPKVQLVGPGQAHTNFIT